MTMVVENKDGKGNPYHDEEGQFTSKEETLALAPLSEQLISHIKEKDLEQKFLETIGLSSLDEAKEILDKMNSKNIKQIAQIFGCVIIRNNK